jgi:hypothetical protein
MFHAISYVRQRLPISRISLASKCHPLTMPLRSYAILVLLFWLTFLVTSNPHRVHHLAPSQPSAQRLPYDDHRLDTYHSASHDEPESHSDEQRAPVSPDCVVLFVFQSLQLLQASHAAVLTPPAPYPLDTSATWFRPCEAHIHVCLARAPPLPMTIV